ncbi:MAG TPA: hypothetical protein DC042_07495 [Bacteroidales bacterium]|nr:hypothetical protein [Bacteroidales bacterium]
MVSIAERRWSSNNPESNVYGTEPYFGCCTANGHQGWPKYTESLWMATPDGGLAAISYAPCQVNALAGKKVAVGIEVTTSYPFEDKVVIQVNPEKTAFFPIYLRIPEWVENPVITINGEPVPAKPGEFLKIERDWALGDKIEALLNTVVRVETRQNKALTVAKGPLFFSLRISKKYTAIENCKYHYEYLGSADWQIEPAGDWNYGLVLDAVNPASGFEVVRNPVGKYPFGDAGDPIYNATTKSFDTLGVNPPIILKAKGKKIRGWGLVNNSAGPVPYSPVVLPVETDNNPSLQDIELVPYGSARLRVSEIPVVK